MLDKNLMPPTPDELIIFVNGEFLPDSQATISALDHGLMYGDGCFDAWCGRNGFIYQLDAHLDRLYRSVEGLKIRNLRDAQGGDARADHRDRPPQRGRRLLHQGPRHAGHQPAPGHRPAQVRRRRASIIYARPQQYEVTPEKLGQRHPDQGARPPQALARGPGAPDQEPQLPQQRAWASWRPGMPATTRACSSTTTATPASAPASTSRPSRATPSSPRRAASWSGITRGTVMEMARDAGMDVETGFYTVFDFTSADEVMMTNTVAGHRAGHQHRRLADRRRQARQAHHGVPGDVPGLAASRAATAPRSSRRPGTMSGIATDRTRRPVGATAGEHDARNRRAGSRGRSVGAGRGRVRSAAVAVLDAVPGRHAASASTACPSTPSTPSSCGATETLAYLIRSYTTWEMTCAGLGHPGGSFSEAEFLAVLFNYVLRFDAGDPDWPMRDVFYLSKGHACPARLHGRWPSSATSRCERLKFYGTWGSGLESHPDSTVTPGHRGQRRLPGPDPRRGGGPRAGHAPQRARPRRPHGLRAARRRRVQRGLGLGGLHGGRPLQARQPRLRHRLQQGRGQGLPRPGHEPRAAGRQAARLQPRRPRDAQRPRRLRARRPLQRASARSATASPRR